MFNKVKKNLYHIKINVENSKINFYFKLKITYISLYYMFTKIIYKTSLHPNKYFKFKSKIHEEYIFTFTVIVGIIKMFIQNIRKLKINIQKAIVLN